jgi:hypothetical protein
MTTRTKRTVQVRPRHQRQGRRLGQESIEERMRKTRSSRKNTMKMKMHLSRAKIRLRTVPIGNMDNAVTNTLIVWVFQMQMAEHFTLQWVTRTSRKRLQTHLHILASRIQTTMKLKLQ